MNELDDQLYWLAFRYVAGEMGPEEEESFEERLADDQRAREAVEQAVELSEAVRAAMAEPAGAGWPGGSAVRAHFGWLAAAAASVAAVGLGCWLLLTGSPREVAREGGQDLERAEVASAESLEEASVALVWAEFANRPEGEEGGEASADWDALEDEELEPEAAGVARAEGELPAWLLTAVSGETGEEVEEVQ